MMTEMNIDDTEISNQQQ